MKYLVKLEVTIEITSDTVEEAQRDALAIFVDVSNQYGEEYPVKNITVSDYIDEEEIETH